MALSGLRDYGKRLVNSVPEKVYDPALGMSLLGLGAAGAAGVSRGKDIPTVISDSAQGAIGGALGGASIGAGLGLLGKAAPSNSIFRRNPLSLGILAAGAGAGIGAYNAAASPISPGDKYRGMGVPYGKFSSQLLSSPQLILDSLKNKQEAEEPATEEVQQAPQLLRQAFVPETHL